MFKYEYKKIEEEENFTQEQKVNSILRALEENIYRQEQKLNDLNNNINKKDFEFFYRQLYENPQWDFIDKMIQEARLSALKGAVSTIKQWERIKD